MAKTSSRRARDTKTVSRELVKAVMRIAERAHAPYSHVRVGAGIYCASGRIYTGANIENSSYSLTLCAERVALGTAISQGEKTFRLLLLYSPEIDFIVPCGACLQVLSEFAPRLVIATMNRAQEFKFYPLEILLAKPFRL